MVFGNTIKIVYFKKFNFLYFKIIFDINIKNNLKKYYFNISLNKKYFKLLHVRM
jgi:hypothetical protein